MKKRKLLWTGLLLAALYLLMIFLLVAAESAAADANITDLPSAFWYSLTTLTTVGYGDTYPVTAAGRIIGVVFQLLSVGMLAFLIGAAVEILRGRLFPMLRLRFRLKREWYVFSSCGTASAALAASLEKEMKDPVILFLRSGGSEKPPVGMSVNVSPETLLRVKKDAGGFHLFCMSADVPENEALAARFAGSGCHVYCMSPYMPDQLSPNEVRFDPYTCCARIFWHRYPLTSAREKIVLVGGGRYGEALLEQALQFNVVDDRQAVCYSLLGDWENFRRNHPFLPLIAPPGTEEEKDRVVFCGGEWNTDLSLLEEADRIVFCGDSESEIIEQLSECRKYCALSGTVYARISVPLSGVAAFGTPEEIFTPMLVMRTKLDRLAVALHEHYCAAAKTPQPSWAELGSFTRRSNLASADHLPVKLRILSGPDTELSPENCAEACRRFREAEPERRESFRRIEHERWMRFHLLNNWRYDPVRDNAGRRHPLLLPYEQLSPEEQKKDDYSWELLKDLAEMDPDDLRSGIR